MIFGASRKSDKSMTDHSVVELSVVVDCATSSRRENFCSFWKLTSTEIGFVS